MGRNLYLVRHGKVAFPDERRRCIGRTEYPLHETGVRQAKELAAYFRFHPLERVYTSPLIRAVQTAQVLADGRYPVCEIPELTELDMGEWEDIPLSDLHKALESEPVQGERRADGCQRFAKAIRQILSETTGDIAVVAHAGINCCYLGSLIGMPLEVSRALPQPYGCFSRLEIGENQGQELYVAELGHMPKEFPSREDCLEIWDHYGTPGQVRLHCEAVCREAMEIGRHLQACGQPVSLELIGSAALLHDVARHKSDHALAGAQILMREGYPEVAGVVIRHHDWNRNLSMEAVPFVSWYEMEAAVVYLADKRVQGVKRISLEERFSASGKRCRLQQDAVQALAAHRRRYQEAKTIERRICNYLV